MNAKRMLFLIGGLAVIALAASRATGAGLQPMIVTNIAGNLHVAQGIPCGTAKSDSAITGGRIEMTPANGVDVPGGKQFTLTRASLSFAPFNVSGSCLGFGATRHYTNVDVGLGNAVSFTATALGGGVFAVTIPKDDFLIYEAAVVDGDPENSYKHPSQDVTGTIDFTNKSVEMTVVLANKVKFKEGCALGVCVIDETDSGTMTTTLTGTIVLPDTDGDGVVDGPDNCRLVPNPDQSPVPTPVITAPPALTLNSCVDHSIGVASAVEVCENRGVTVSNNAPATFLIGPNTVTWSGNDNTHPVVTATQTVTIDDKTQPLFTSVPPDVALNDCKAADLGLPTATDDCAGNVTFTNNAPPIFFVGSTVVTWTARDVSGNTSTDTQRVTVTDTAPPTVSCVAQNPVGNGFLVSAVDHCDPPVIRLGNYVLQNGENIKITVSGTPGVQLINMVNGVRHFKVGKGEDVITATDASHNVTSVVCR